MTAFWKGWLNLWCLGVALLGLVLAGAAFEATDGPVRMLLAIWGGPPYDPDAHHRFSYGLSGAVTFGWSLSLYAAIRAATMLGDAGTPIWRIVGISALLWFAIDSSISVATGFWPNAVANTVFLTLFFVPLLASGVLRRGS